MTAAAVVRGALAAVFLASALLKAVDLHATGALLASLLGTPGATARALAAALALRLRPERGVTLAVLALLGAFTAVAGWMLTAGVENCGCFGTRFDTGPAATLARNLVLMAMAALLLRRPGPAQPRDHATS